MRFPYLLFVLIFTLALLVSCNSERNTVNDEKNKREERESNIQRDLAGKYGASIDWAKKLNEKEKPIPYTIDMEEALIGPGSTPIMFVAYVVDVIKKDDKFSITLKYLESPEILFTLECKPEIGKRLLIRTRREFDPVVVVGIISSVRKATVKLEGEPSIYLEEPTDIDVTTSDMFIAQGMALDLEFLEGFP